MSSTLNSMDDAEYGKFKAAQRNLLSDDPQTVETAITTIDRCCVTNSCTADSLDTQTFERIVSIISSPKQNLSFLHSCFILIADLCELHPSFIRRFYKYQIDTKIINLLSLNENLIPFEPPLRVMTSMTNWISRTFERIINNGFLDALLGILSRQTVPLSDKRSALIAVKSLLSPKWLTHPANNNAFIVNLIDPQLLFKEMANFAVSDESMAEYAFQILDRLHELFPTPDPNLPFSDIAVQSLPILHKAKPHLACHIAVFICNVTYSDDTIAAPLLEKNMLQIFDELLTRCIKGQTGDSAVNSDLFKVGVDILRIITNIYVSPTNIQDQILSSKFLNTAYNFLLEGALPMKTELVTMFQRIYENSSGDQLKFVFNEFPLPEILSQLISVDDDVLDKRILKCIDALYQIVAVTHVVEPSVFEPLKDPSVIERLAELSLSPNEKISNLSVNITNRTASM